ncbi:MAG: hypothetical protein ACI9Z3_000881 [Roseivirga sp.]|jgi:hypothetical protein
MSILGKKFLSVSNRTHSAKKKGELQFKPFAQSESIGILYTWEDTQKEKFVQEFGQSLGEGKEIRFLCYNPDRKVNVNTENPVFTLAELSMFGKITSEHVTTFQERPLDFLFHLDFELNEMTKAVVIGSKAHWKVGSHSENGEVIYDLMIKMNLSAGLKNLAEQMLLYVKALK